MIEFDRRLGVFVLIALAVAVLSAGTTHAVLNDTENVTVEFVEDTDSPSTVKTENGSSVNDSDAQLEGDAADANGTANDTDERLRPRIPPAETSASDPATVP